MDPCLAYGGANIGKKNDSICDGGNNNAFCEFDGGDCCLPKNQPSLSFPDKGEHEFITIFYQIPARQCNCVILCYMMSDEL